MQSEHHTTKTERSRRSEAIFVGVMWCCAAAYTVGYCGIYGYGRPLSDLKFVLGFPDWVFWGIVVPWTVCLVVGVVFTCFMRDDDLGGEATIAPVGSAAGETDEEPAHG